MKAACLCLLLLLTACSSRTSAEQTVDEYFSALQRGDLGRVVDLSDAGEAPEVVRVAVVDPARGELYRAIWKQMAVKVGRQEAGRQGSILVPVTMKTVALGRVVANVLNDPAGGRDLESELRSLALAPDAPTAESVIPVYLTQVGGSWKVSGTPGLSSALIGMD